MKKLLVIFSILFLFATQAFSAAGTVVTPTMTNSTPGFVTVKFICTGGTVGDAGTIPNTAVPANIINYLKRAPHYLYRVVAYPTSGGTAPDAADIFVLDANSMDLLGCEDGSTTAYAGLTMIHATLTRSCLPNLYLPRAGEHINYYPEVTGAMTLKVSNQATASANWTVELIFVKGD